MQIHSRCCGRSNPYADRRVQTASRTGPAIDRGKRPDMRCAIGSQRRSKKDFEAIVAVETSSERLVGNGVTDDIDMEATAAKRTETCARTVAKRFNTDHSDRVGPACACGGEAHGAALENLHNGVGRNPTGTGSL